MVRDWVGAGWIEGDAKSSLAGGAEMVEGGWWKMWGERCGVEDVG